MRRTRTENDEQNDAPPVPVRHGPFRLVGVQPVAAIKKVVCRIPPLLLGEQAELDLLGVAVYGGTRSARGTWPNGDAFEGE